MDVKSGQTQRPAAREERKVVTVLFADVVGSTALAERLDMEEVRYVVGEAIARIVLELERLGGYVKDLAGDGVLAFFGAPVSAEDDPERAIRAGLGILDAIEHYAQEVSASFAVRGFGVRIGITTGPVVLGEIGAGSRIEYAAFGDTVNTAARLEGAAEPGTLLVDAATHRLVEPLFDWEAPVALRLKGKAEPVMGHRALRARPGAVKTRGLAGRDVPMVGRAAELESAREMLRGLGRGAGGVLFVSGEAGIGKSRVISELRENFAANDPAPIWLEGRCVSYGDSLPLWPFRDLVRNWLGVAANDPPLRVRLALRRQVDRLFAANSGSTYPYLAALIGVELEGDAAARLGELSPEALQYRTFEVVRALLGALSRQGPVVVVLEDLHWGDASSVGLAESLLGLGEEGPVLVIIAMREDRDHPSWRLRETAAREFPHLLRVIGLGPLAPEAEAGLLRKLVGEGILPAAIEERILKAAEGNPFFLEELVRSLSDRGAIVREGTEWRFEHAVALEVPPTVEKVVLARVDALDAPAREAITAASALGRTFSVPLLEGVLGSTGAAESLHKLERLDLVRALRRWPEAEFSFKHALIQEAVYGTLLAEQRRELHRRATTWLEERHRDNLDPVLGVLAHHSLAAGDEDRAVTFLTRAGDAARREWALDEAVEHYRALVPVLERRGDRQASALVLLKQGLALHTALRFTEAQQAFDDAFQRWTPPVACAQPAATVRVAWSMLASQPDPRLSYERFDIQVQMALFDRLVERWPEGAIVPSFASRWEVSPDGLRYVFHLREGLAWSDGTPLTARDIEYGVRSVLDPGRPGVSAAIYYVLENGQDYALGRNADADRIGVRALDDRTVEFRLVAPAPYFLSVANRPDCGPLPRHAIEKHGDRWLDPALQVVSGAFRQVERSSAVVSLERRVEARAHAGNIRHVVLMNGSAAELARRYADDEVDLVIWSGTRDTTKLDAVAIEARQLGPVVGTSYIAFDMKNPLCANLDVRRALAHGLDRAALVRHLPSLLVEARGGIVPPALQGHTPDIALRYDPDLARSLATALEGRPLRFFFPVDVGEPFAEALAAAWREALGDAITFVPCTPEQWMQGFGKCGELTFSGWHPGYPDPEYFLRLLLQSESRDNVGRWTHAPFDALIEEARREADGKRRLELFHKADRMAVTEQVAVIPFAYSRNVFYVKPRLKGWWEFGKSWASFADLTVG
jgi:ABC-type oligopeptide transport system substrate-binding subunit/class 3 adenylate cyclase